MPFIGTQPEVGGYSVLDALTASATASYTLQLNSANFVPASVNQLLVSLNGVIQKPGSSFTVSGSTLTFSSALTSSDSIDFIISMGEPLLIGTPSDNTITTNKLVNDSVTGAKIENNPTIAGNLTVSGNTAASGTLTSTGLITASAGVAIGGTGSANTLDDFEEGSWTPTVVNATGYSAQFGRYVKVGKLVFINGNLHTSTTSAPGAVIDGLPFASSNTGNSAGNLSIGYYSNIATAVIWIGGYVLNNSTYMYIVGNSDGHTGTTLQRNGFNWASGSSRVMFSGVYETDS